MAQDLTGKYFVKNTAGGTFADVTALFDGLRILKVDGFLAKGKPVNIYTAQWFGSQEEDFMITSFSEQNALPAVTAKIQCSNTSNPPVPISLESTDIEGVGATGTIQTDVTGISLLVDGIRSDVNVSVVYNNGHLEVSPESRIRVPVRSVGDTITTVTYSADCQYTVGGVEAERSQMNTYHVTHVDAHVGYVDIIATGSEPTDFYGIHISMQTVNYTPKVIRENVDVEVTFIVRQKYASRFIDVQSVHDAFIEYITGSDVWIKSAYVNNKYVHCVCLDEYKPTTAKLQRGEDSWIIGTVKLHTLDAPET